MNLAGRTLFACGAAWLVVVFSGADFPDVAKLEPVAVLEVPNYCEGVVFDHEGRGYVSEGERIIRFTLDGKFDTWAVTGSPNGHKILADGTHLVCDAKAHAILHLAADGKPLPHAASTCDGEPLAGPNDITLDMASGGFYFSNPGESSKDNPIGTIHYVDAAGKVTRLDGGLAYPNGIVFDPDHNGLLLAESQRNRVLVYEVLGPGKLGERRVFADLPAKDAAAGQIDDQPDGMCLDAEGRLYVAHYGMRQVQVLGLDGKVVARLPGGNLTTSNVAFGGPDRNQLFVTGGLAAYPSQGGLFRLDLGVVGRELLEKK